MVKLAMRIDRVHIFTKGGLTYVYYRRGPVKVRIRRDPSDAAGIKAEVERIERQIAQKGSASSDEFATGTLGALVAAYKTSTWWPENESTRKSYDRAFAAMKGFMGMQTAHLSRPAIIRLRDEGIFPVRGRWMANYVVTVLSIVFAYGFEHGLMKANPLADRVRTIRKARDARKVNRPWSEAERSLVLTEAPPHMRLVIALAMCTGLRKKDLFRLTLSSIDNGEISIKTAKRGKMARIPMHPVLTEALKDRPKSDAVQIAVRLDGLPFTADGFDTIWDRFKKKLEADGKVGHGLTIHGLRHTFGSVLMEAGVDPNYVRKLMTHSSMKQTDEYTEEAALPKKAKAQVVKLQFRSGK